MRDIKDFSPDELKEIFKEWGEPVFRARQILSWIYKKKIRDFSGMSDLSLGFRERLKKSFYISSFKLVKAFSSYDGTEKFLLELPDKNLIEAVVIPAEKRITGCVSTQVGCKFACSFCASGMLGFKRNLSCAEMIEEALYLKEESAGKRLTHLVFMGTGEPLDNYDNVLKAIRVINSPYSLNIGARRITISTCGIIPGIEKLANENLQIELSVSLHAAEDIVRSRLMPVNKVYPLKDLVRACGAYIRKTNRQVTFEYILIKGVNSGLQSARKLSKILAGLNSKVNLIPANPIEGFWVGPPDRPEIVLFRDFLLKSGINVTLRKPRGEDIDAACGQLRLRTKSRDG
jgi:23S rRNA (adenine2503-C2)-methyltransferase